MRMQEITMQYFHDEDDLNGDPVDYWLKQAEDFPELSVFAAFLICCPVQGASCERMFKYWHLYHTNNKEGRRQRQTTRGNPLPASANSKQGHHLDHLHRGIIPLYFRPCASNPESPSQEPFSLHPSFRYHCTAPIFQNIIELLAQFTWR